MDGQGRLTVRRRPQLADNLRAYRVVVDGEVVAKLRNGQHHSGLVRAGRHEVYLSVDWFRSRALDVQLAEGEEVVLEGGNNVYGWRIPVALLAMIVRPSRYLFLRRV